MNSCANTPESKKKFLQTLGKNLGYVFLPSIILAEIFVIQFLLSGSTPAASTFMGIVFIIAGNLLVYMLLACLYYWKSEKKQLNDLSVRNYFTNGKVSLRPWSGYSEIIILTFFFLVQPEIIVGYLILRGIEGYRGKDNDQSNKAELKGELNAVKAIGLVLNLFVSMIAAGLFRHTQLFHFLNSNFDWLMKSHFK